jgi:hypothetical protein
MLHASLYYRKYKELWFAAQLHMYNPVHNNSSVGEN